LNMAVCCVNIFDPLHQDYFMSSAPSPIDLRSRLTWKQRIKARWDAFAARLTANPMLVVCICVMVVSATIFLGSGVYHDVVEHAASAKIMRIKEGTLHDLSVALKDNKLESITHHNVYKNPSWIDPQMSHASVFVLRDKTRFRMDHEVLSDEVLKKITQASEKNSFHIREGEVYPKPNKITTITGTLFFYASFMMVILAAQMLVGEVVSGHTFAADKRDQTIQLSDVIGYPDVKREVLEIMDKIKNAHIYAQQGIKPPRGLLFLGDPGVGKTMLAKAMANEMKAKFFYCTGADFAEMYVGVGPRRVRALFKRARKHARSFIFIDEIDAIGSRNSMGNDSERQSVINQFLAEMDGVNNNTGLIVVGATNHANLLDPAMRRPGRFDKEIHIPLPDLDTRQGILAKYMTGFTLSDTVDLLALAHRTQGYSGAMLNGLIEETKNLALRQANGGPLVITQELLEQAQEVGLLGVSSTRAQPEDIDRVAVHELGHALAGLSSCPDLHVEKVTIAGRGRALGYTSMRPVHDRTLRTEIALRGDLMMRLGGRAAEQIVLGGVSSGAADDLERATELAREMVERFGMGRTTGLMVPPRSHDPGAMPDSVRIDVKELLEHTYEQACALMEQNLSWFENKRQQLRTVDTITHSMLMEGLAPGTPVAVVEDHAAKQDAAG
jgi:ATP-dependent metalloprotease FtsH